MMCVRLILHILLGVIAFIPSGLCENPTQNNQVKMFQSLFKQRRQQHRAAVETMLGLGDQVKQQKMVSVIAAKIFEVLGQKQVVLREAGYIPGMDFPEEESVRNALSQTLENTAFLGEILLHLPEITHDLLRQNRPWQLLFTWGVFFATQSKFLDKSTAKFIYLVSQELGLAEKDPNYTNPYTRKDHKRSSSATATNTKAKKKKTFKKGPQLSRHFGDL